jgi:uncharacterized coiled-coil protein SlyX
LNDEIDAALAALPTAAENVEVEETADPVEETVEPQESVVETPEERLYAGKFKTIEELEAAVTQQEEFIGRQKNEVGESRAEVQALKEQFEALQTQLQQPTASPFDAPAEWDNINFENAAQARSAAIWVAQNQPYAYESYLESWYEQSPRAATQFEIEMKDYEWQQKLDERLAPLTPIPERIEADDKAAQVTATFEKVWADIGAQNPDLNDYADKIIEEARSIPAMAAVFQQNDADQMQQALQILLNGARYRRSQAEEISAAETAEAADAAKSKAKVVTAASTAGSRAVPKSSPMANFLEEAFAEHGKFAPPL